jgi:hypothetical protein
MLYPAVSGAAVWVGGVRQREGRRWGGVCRARDEVEWVVVGLSGVRFGGWGMGFGMFKDLWGDDVG